MGGVAVSDLPKCSDCEIFAPQENGRCWACAGREDKRPSQIYTLTMGEGLGDNGQCSVCGWHCAGEVGVALQTPREVPAGYRAPALCIFCARFVSRLVAQLGGPTQNPLPAEAPQVPENTPAAEAPADPTQNDPIASAADEHGPFPADPEHCSSCKSGIPRFIGRDHTGAVVDIVHAIEPEKFSTGGLMWQQQCTVSPALREAAGAADLSFAEIGFPQTATNILAREAGAELGREIGRTAVAAAEAAEQAPAAAETWGICEINRKPHVLWRDHKCVGWVS